MSNFHPDHADPIAFLNCRDAFQVTHTPYFSIENMSDEELRQSIIEDLVAVTMWEKLMSKKLHFGFSRFLYWIPRYMHKRVREQMSHPEIEGLICIQRTENNSEIRIRDNHAIIQAAMDYCGVWYDGFVIPKGVRVFSVNHERIEELGGIDAVAELVTKEIISAEMDEKATAPMTSGVN